MATYTNRRLAVVTGASSGIGLAITQALLASDWGVCAISRTAPPIADDRITHLPCDLTDQDALAGVVAQLAAGPRPTAFVHAAGLQRTARLGDQDPAASLAMWQVHVHAAEVLANGLAPHLVDGGRIILLGSRTAIGVAGKSQYGATKAALSALARSWARELVERRITVNVVAPGPTRTPMLADPNRSQTPPLQPPLGRLIEPDEVAQLVLFLLENTGAMITGQTVTICGGTSLG